ncbi:hypothetical protein [Streptomyces sp. NPDC001914]|uniref:hypothetical protein n=1 Tax=Streptomyces sp. NPDC001914 TaxID=3364623 RepID=UPI003684731A
MPDDLDDLIYGQVAADLAAMTEPDLSAFARGDVDQAMIRVYPPSGPRPEWLEGLRRRIAHDSIFQTRLEAADPADFPFRVKEFAASYHRLANTSGETRLLVMGPMQPPVQFVPDDPGRQGGSDGN